LLESYAKDSRTVNVGAPRLGGCRCGRCSFGGFMLAWFQEPAGSPRRAPPPASLPGTRFWPLVFRKHMWRKHARLRRLATPQVPTSWWRSQVVVHLKPPPRSRFSGNILRCVRAYKFDARLLWLYYDRAFFWFFYL